MREVAFISYHFHWGHDDVLALEHRDRIRWVEEISRINAALNESSGEHGMSASLIT
jgi:Family of unknown function (DUF6760)